MLRKLFALPLIMLSSIAVVLAADCPAVLDHRLRALASNEAVAASLPRAMRPHRSSV